MEDARKTKAFLRTQPSWSTNSVVKLSKKVRRNEAYDVDLFDLVIAQAAALIEALTPPVKLAVEEFGLTEIEGESLSLHPRNDTNCYVFSSRPKTVQTTLDKLRRSGTSLDRIDDIAGLRIDATFTLSDQQDLALRLEQVLQSLGAKRTRVKSHLEEPHSGYRARHVVAEFDAGRVEIQIRTALQAMWANAFEVLADAVGREIRYQSWQEIPSQDVRHYVELMHELSDDIYRFELDCSERYQCYPESVRVFLQQESQTIFVRFRHLLANLREEYKRIRDGLEGDDDRISD